jgi:uncharacterized protein (TIGR00369 family)
MNNVEAGAETGPEKNAGLLRISPFQHYLGYAVLRWSAEETLLELPISPHHLNRNGVLHGGVLMTMLDTACGLAAGHAPGLREPQPTVTVALTCNFIASVSGGRIFARGRVDGGGKRISATYAEIRDEDDRLLATGIGSFRRFTPPRR